MDEEWGRLVLLRRPSSCRVNAYPTSQGDASVPTLPFRHSRPYGSEAASQTYRDDLCLAKTPLPPAHQPHIMFPTQGGMTR